ncbi:MAG: DegT/DnrJ/EryC1/StrS aminotransferase family protein [Sphingobacteriaceae bacterium]|nr:DegT/DnrJ/EryC1/StrS aminotransferase family protein [Sphingobacteriaceae bacterium]
MLIVPAKPFDSPYCDKEASALPLRQKNIASFESGRYALKFLLEYFGVMPGEKVLIPAYICASSLEPLLASGYKIAFIDLNYDWSINENDLLAVLKSEACSVVVLPVYFGLFDTCSDMIYQKCKSIGVKVIKDYAHSYLSYLYRTDEENCDALILSIRKSVNVLHGGVAIVNNTHSLYFPGCRKRAAIEYIKYNIAKAAEKYACRLGVNLYSPFLTKIKTRLLKKGEPKTPMNELETMMVDFVDLLHLLDKNGYSAGVAASRRVNFSKLRNLCHNKVDVKEIRGEVPQIFPIWGDAKLLEYFRENGVGATMWPSFDVPKQVLDNIQDFPVTSFFMNNIICLPVHHGLQDKHLNKIHLLNSTYKNEDCRKTTDV